MFPLRISTRAAVVLMVMIACWSEAPVAFAHGGAGAGGHSRGHGASHGGASGAYYHQIHGRFSGFSSNPGTLGITPQAPWVGFPEDLPFNRLQRFVGSHWHHLPHRPPPPGSVGS
jgi:hypothetical protein